MSYEQYTKPVRRNAFALYMCIFNLHVAYLDLYQNNMSAPLSMKGNGVYTEVINFWLNRYTKILSIPMLVPASGWNSMDIILFI